MSDLTRIQKFCIAAVALGWSACTIYILIRSRTHPFSKGPNEETEQVFEYLQPLKYNVNPEHEELLNESLLNTRELLGMEEAHLEELHENAVKINCNNQGAKDISFAYSNYKLLEALQKSSVYYAEDATIRAWALSGFNIRKSSSFCQILRIFQHYSNFERILASLGDYFYSLLALKDSYLVKTCRIEVQDKIESLQVACDEAFVSFLLEIIVKLDSDPELVGLVIEFFNGDDDQRLKTLAQNFLIEDSIKPAFLDCLEDLKNIPPYDLLHDFVTP